MEGMAGAGAFSDGKYVISTEYGGWLTEFLEPETVINYIEQADDILVRFGATTERFMPNNELKLECIKHDLHMAQAQLKHLGTDSNFETMRKLIIDLGTRCDIITDTEVTAVDKNSRVLTMVNEGKEYYTEAEHIIFAVGRFGSKFFAKWCRDNDIKLKNNQVDIGVRVEMPAIIWDNFSKKIYEPKIWYRSKQYGDTTRMFCFNERGGVVTENTDGVLTVNGHSYRMPQEKLRIQTLHFFQQLDLQNHSKTLLLMLVMWQVLQTLLQAAEFLYKGWAIWKMEEEPKKNVLHSQLPDLL